MLDLFVLIKQVRATCLHKLGHLSWCGELEGVKVNYSRKKGAISLIPGCRRCQRGLTFKPTRRWLTKKKKKNLLMRRWRISTVSVVSRTFHSSQLLTPTQLKCRYTELRILLHALKKFFAVEDFIKSASRRNNKKKDRSQMNAVATELNVSSLLYPDTLVALWPYWWQPHECFPLFRLL